MFEDTTKGNCGWGELTSNERIFWCMGWLYRTVYEDVSGRK